MDKNNSYPKTTITLLWTTVMFLMIFADIFSIILELELGNTIQIPIDVTTAMAIAAVVTAIPILMIVFSWVLPYKINRRANIIVGIFTIIYVIAGGTLVAHYIILAGLEVILLVSIIIISLKWKQEKLTKGA